MLPPTNPETEITSDAVSCRSSPTAPTARSSTTWMRRHAHGGRPTSRPASTAPAADYVRIAARYQENGTLVAVRVWASSNFNTVWVSPEGHVLQRQRHHRHHHGRRTRTGVGAPVQRQRQHAVLLPARTRLTTRPIAHRHTGSSPASDLVRGFKVHVSVVDPLANAAGGADGRHRDGRLRRQPSRSCHHAAPNGGFTYTRDFLRATDDYSRARSTTSPTGRNGGHRPERRRHHRFEWWNFTFPTLATTRQ